uniref:C2H2-type domain-containing protein n=1 Tax=Neogobius melanostomus TaxID=47308 RepID=A0A8C6TW87_9GOBI
MCGHSACHFHLLDGGLQTRLAALPLSLPTYVFFLQVQPKEEPLSDTEEADVKSFVVEGESEGNSDEDSKPPLDRTATNSETKTTTTTATEESEDGGGDDWIPPWTNNWTTKTADAEESDKEEDEEEEEEQSEETGADEKNSDDDWTPPQLNTRTLTKSNSDDEQTAKPSSGEESAGTGESSTLAHLQEVSSILEHRPGKRKLCTECGMFYRNLPHECEHKIKPFVCNICGKRCVSESYLKLHYGIHMETYEHPCKFCYANFKTRVDKLAHELVHQEQEDPYRCPDCALTFPSFKGRAEHAKQHRDENPFKCAICGTEFGDRPAFLRHMVVHTGERGFKCPVCGRGFNQGSHLKSHMRLHTGERPYACKLCDKSFTHNVSLKSHVQRYHAAKREDTSSETQDTGADGETERKEEKEGKEAKSKCRRPLTGRPKGRPKRVAAQNRKPYKAIQDSDDGSSEYDFSMFYM